MGKTTVRALCVLLAFCSAAVGCGGNAKVSGPPSEGDTVESSSAITTPTSTPTSVWDSPVVDARFSVGPDNVTLALRCWGKGEPTIVLEGGSGEGGLGRWEYNPVTEALAAQTRVCSYDRAGVGESAPAPDHARGLDEVSEEVHFLLEAAQVEPPYIMAGISGGGFYAFHFAGRFPDDVAGLVLIETPPGQAKMSGPIVKELAWDNPGNSEHVDYVAVEHQMAVARLPIPPIPVTVVTGRFGQSADDLGSQKVWLKGASPGRQVVLETGHEVDQDDAEGLVRALVGVLKLAR